MAKRKQPDPPALSVIDGLLKFEGQHQCYFIGEGHLVLIKSMEDAAGKSVWYRRSNFGNLQSIDVPK